MNTQWEHERPPPSRGWRTKYFRNTGEASASPVFFLFNKVQHNNFLLALASLLLSLQGVLDQAWLRRATSD